MKLSVYILFCRASRIDRYCEKKEKEIREVSTKVGPQPVVKPVLYLPSHLHTIVCGEPLLPSVRRFSWVECVFVSLIVAYCRTRPEDAGIVWRNISTFEIME